MSKDPELIAMLVAYQPAADSGSAVQAWGNEENNCTLPRAHNPLGYTDAVVLLRVHLLVVSFIHYCAGHSHLGVWQNSGPETWMSPELAQPSCAAGRKHSHRGNGLEQRAMCKKPISIHCISTARWIAELRACSFRSDQLPEPIVFTFEL